MKITKYGNTTQMWRGTCRSCKSEAEADRKEMIDIQHDQREGYEFCWMICPVCRVGPYGGMLFYQVKG